MLQNPLNSRLVKKLSATRKLLLSLHNSFSEGAKKHDSSKTLEETPVSKLLEEATTFNEISSTEWATTPYPKTAAQLHEDLQPKKPTFNPLDTSVILFPGQGIIKVGDVNKYIKFPRAKELFKIANEILGYDLLKMCLRGPQNILDRTEFNQPATVVLSLAALEKLMEERPRAIESCVAVAGYSVGELTALIFSGAIPYEEGLKLVGIRAAAMQNASEMSRQGMLSCYCQPQSKVSQICIEAEKWAMDIGASNPVCRIAIYLYTQGKIFGGSKEALEYIEKNHTKLGLRNIKRLPVSGAFHTSLMEPALKPFIRALDKIPVDESNVPVYSNFSTNIYNSNEKLSKKYLTRQIVSPVKWEQIIQKLYQRPQDTPFPRTFDVGSSGTMKSILRMINSKAASTCHIY